MKVVLGLAWRELRDRSRLLWVAPLVCLLSWPLAESGLMLLFTVAAVPLVLGVGWLIGGFGPGGRRGFELARPCAAWQFAVSRLAVILGLSTVVLVASGFAGLFQFVGDLRPALLLGQNRHNCWIIPHYLILPINPYSFVWKLWRFLEFPYAILMLVGWIQTIAFAFVGRGWRSLAELGALLYLSAAVARGWRVVAPNPFDVPFVWLPALATVFLAITLIAAWRSITGGALLESAHRRYSAVVIPGFLALGTVLLAASWAFQEGLFL